MGTISEVKCDIESIRLCEVSSYKNQKKLNRQTSTFIDWILAFYAGVDQVLF